MRGVIVGTVVVCLAVAMAPWFSGGQEPVAMLASGFALLLAALLLWRQPEARVLRWGPLAASFVVLLGWAMLSFVWTASRYSTVLWVCEWAMAGVAFWVANIVAGESKGRNWVLAAYLWSAAGFCVVALVMFFGSTYERLTGTFYWANPAAAYLIPAVVLGVDRLRNVRGRSGGLALWALAEVLYLTCFFLTASRAALLVLALVLGVYTLLVSVNKRFWITFVFILTVSVGVSFGLSELSIKLAHHGTNVLPGSRFAAAAKGESSSTSDRLYFLGSALKMWWHHPVLGVGAGTYGDVHPQYQQRVISASSDAHNLFVQVLAELGVVGALALVVLMLFVLAGQLRGLVADPSVLPVVLGAVGLIMHFALDIDASYPVLLVLAAVLLGVVYLPRTSVRGSLSWRLPLATVVLLVPLVGLYVSDMAAIRGGAAQDQEDYQTAADWYASAHSGWLYNPDVVTAEGINLYALAESGGEGAKESADQALELAREAERLDPHDAQHHQLEGRVLALQGNWRGAAAAFRAALKLDALNHPEYALDLATAQLQMGDEAGAVATAEAMAKLYPGPVLSNRGTDATVGPTVSNLWALVGNVRLEQGKLPEARAADTQALAADHSGLRARALQHQLDKSGSGSE